MTEEKRQYMRRYREEHRARIAECNRLRYLCKREEIKAAVSARYEQKKADILLKQKDWRQRTKERQREIKKAWAARHPDKIKVYRRETYLRNKESRKRSAKAWRAQNPEKVKAMQKHFHERHPEFRRARMAIRRNGRMESARETILRLIAIQKGKCHWCGKKYGQNFELDHIIPIAKGGSNRPGNLALACMPCNRAKRDKMPSVFAGRLF